MSYHTKDKREYLCKEEDYISLANHISHNQNSAFSNINKTAAELAVRQAIVEANNTMNKIEEKALTLSSNSFSLFKKEDTASTKLEKLKMLQCLVKDLYHN